MDQNLNFIEVDILFDEHDDMTMENGPKFFKTAEYEPTDAYNQFYQKLGNLVFEEGLPSFIELDTETDHFNVLRHGLVDPYNPGQQPLTAEILNHIVQNLQPVNANNLERFYKVYLGRNNNEYRLFVL